MKETKTIKIRFGMQKPSNYLKLHQTADNFLDTSLHKASYQGQDNSKSTRTETSYSNSMEKRKKNFIVAF